MPYMTLLQYVILHLPCPFSPSDTPMPTIEAITIAFCCFLLLTLAACVGCVFTMFDHEQGVCVCVHACLREKFIDRKIWTEFIWNVLMSPPLIFLFHSSRPRCYNKVSFLFMELGKFWHLSISRRAWIAPGFWSTEGLLVFNSNEPVQHCLCLPVPVLMHYLCPHLCPSLKDNRLILALQILVFRIRYTGLQNTLQHCTVERIIAII